MVFEEIQTTYRRWGGQPVYEPTIKFANEEITFDRLPFVFSDADRRALAFSIFIAKLKKKSESELKNTIILLDDPITSFDDNRISQTFIEIKNLAISCRQLIIAAHHSKFLLDTYERLKDRFRTHEITKDLPERSFWLRLQGMSTEARAKMFVHEFSKASEERKDEIREEIRIMQRVGGIFSPDFREKVRELMRE